MGKGGGVQVQVGRQHTAFSSEYPSWGQYSAVRDYLVHLLTVLAMCVKSGLQVCSTRFCHSCGSLVGLAAGEWQTIFLVSWGIASLIGVAVAIRFSFACCLAQYINTTPGHDYKNRHAKKLKQRAKIKTACKRRSRACRFTGFRRWIQVLVACCAIIGSDAAQDSWDPIVQKMHAVYPVVHDPVHEQHVQIDQIQEDAHVANIQEILKKEERNRRKYKQLKDYKIQNPK